MQSSIIKIDTLKPIGTLVDLTGQFNARVGDAYTPITIQWTEGGDIKNLDGLHPVFEAVVGQGHVENNKVLMNNDAVPVRWVGDRSSIQEYGQTILKLPPQVFSKSGLCYGYLALENDQGDRETSVDIWFKVLGGVYNMGLACNYFITDFQKAIATAEEDLRNSKKSMQTVVDEFTSNMNDLTNRLETQATNDQAALDALEAKIKQEGFFTKAEADTFKQAIKSKMTFSYTNVANLAADTDLKEGKLARTMGYYSIGDGGAAHYVIVDTEPSTHYEKLSNGLYAKLIITDHVTPEQYGAKGDGINDDTQAVQSALMSNNLVEFPAGKSYHTTSTITITQVVNLNGNFSPIVYDGTDTAVSFNAEGLPSHQRDMGAVNDLKIKAPNADIALNWNYAIKTVVRGLKIYNFKHIGINMQNAGYESKMDDVYLIGKAGQQTIGIAGAANDMSFGSCYGLNCKTYMKMMGGAIYVNYIHAWCGNVDTEDNPALTDDEYNSWYKQTCIIDYCNPDNAANTTINYLYADHYYTVAVWNTKSTENLIKTLKMLAVSGPLLKLGEGASATSTANLVIDDLYVPDYKYYVANNYSLYPTIKKINGEKAMKVIEVDVNGTKVPITEGRITQYSFTATEDTPQYTNVKGIEDLPMLCNNKDWGAAIAIRIGQKIDESVSYLTSPLPNETTNIFTLFLRPLPIRKGKSFKYVIDDLNWKG